MIKSSFGVGRNIDDPKSCVAEAVKDFKNPKLIMFFSGEDNFSEYTIILHELFPDAVCIGCMTYRTWDVLGTEKNILNVVAIEDGITCQAGVMKKVDNFVLSYTDKIKSCLDDVGETENTICIEFTVPYKRTEEYALMALNSILLRKEIPIIGGTASNTSIFEDACVSLNGEVYTEGCVFAIIHSCCGKIHLFSENIYKPRTGKKYTVTKANSKSRTTMTYDGRPAAEVYCSELNITPDEIGKYIFNNPIGQCFGDEIFLTAIRGTGSNGSLKHLARVHEGTEIVVMEEDDYRAITKKTISDIKKIIEKPSLVIMFNCVARTVLFEKNGYIDEYQQHLAEAFPKFIGLSCLSEQIRTKNFNHTMMMVVFE